MRIKSLYIVIAALLAGMSQPAIAQTEMTDEEIAAIVNQMKNDNLSEQQIMVALNDKGIPVERLQKINNLKTEHSTTKHDVESAKEITTDKVSKPENRKMVDKVKIFGHDVFNKNGISFEPNDNLSTPADYHLGTGDVVYIDVFGATQKTINCQINKEGNITIPLVGPINISGLTVSQANARLRSQMGEQYADSRIQLNVSKAKTIMIQVMGEVNYPGTYTMSSYSSVFHALYMAGGPNEIGTLREIKVFRDGRQVSTVDVYDYILNGNLSGNISLKDNDVIVVSPAKCLVSISGKVWRPMTYEMKTSETVETLIKYAGGFTGDAYKEEVQMVRSSTAEKTIYSINEDEMHTFRLSDRDAVQVGEVLDRFSNRIEISGAVFRPGHYQLGNRILTVRDLVAAAKGVTEIAYPDFAVLHRRRADRTLEAISVDLKGILENTVPDMALQKDDALFVPTRADMMEDRTVSIYGEVHNPGEYAYAEKQTLESLIMLAGGLTDRASLQRVEVSRRIVDQNALTKDSIKSETYNFRVQNGFIVAGEIGFELKPFDRIFVRRSPQSDAAEMVSVSGKVNFAGNYALYREGMRLSDLVQQAGGTRIGAYIRGARLIRRITDEERKVMQDVLDKLKRDYMMLEAEERSKSDNKDVVDYTARINELKLGDEYYIGIELDKALANPGSDEDIVLRHDDKLIIPEYSGTVTINGEVEKTNSVPYIKGKKLKYYIEQAGGYSQYAKKSHAFIIHMNGTIAKARDNSIEPGCQIVVPTRSLRNKWNLQEIMSVGTTSASLATMIASLVNIIKR